MRGKPAWLLILTALMAAPAASQPDQTVNDEQAVSDAPPMIDDTLDPDLAFLEFLGLLVEDDAGWIDPLDASELLPNAETETETGDYARQANNGSDGDS
ncbi:MAG: hypothetical protein AAF918_17365 [Pseudomonadota bacterium]